jgi:hypothetical protein
METVWAEQIEQHAAGLPYTVLNMPRARRLTALEALKGPRVAIHSHEDIPALGGALSALDWDLIVIDETGRFRNASAQRTGRMTGFQARPLTAPFRLGLSGLPMIKSATDLYPVLRWLGAPTGNKHQFVERFMYQQPYSQELRLRDEAGLRSLLDCWRFQVPRSSVLDLPRAWHYERVQLLPWQRALYRKLQRELRGLDAEPSENVLVELLRLAQVTAGLEGERYRYDNAKLAHLVEKLLPELGEEQVVIWTRFQQEALGVLNRLRTLGKSAVAYTGGHSDSLNVDAYKDFTAGRSQYFVATLAKGSMGLNLPMAQAMVYLTRDFDTEAWAQSLERNARLSTTHSSLNVFVVEAENSIDQKVTKVLGDDLHEAARLTTLDVAEVLGR